MKGKVLITSWVNLRPFVSVKKFVYDTQRPFNNQFIINLLSIDENGNIGFHVRRVGINVYVPLPPF